MRARLIRALVAISVVASAFAVPATAYSAAPYSTASQIANINFESGAPDTLTEMYPITVPGEPAPVAYWGTTTAVKNGGTTSLWCAGKSNPGGGAREYGTYPSTTRGRAVKLLPQLADYYSAKLSFYYLVPSLGGADDNPFVVAWSAADADGDSTGYVRTLNVFPLTSTWKKSGDHDLSSGRTNLSRTSSRLVFSFFDWVETYESPLTGAGASVDDIVITGFKYGPVRSVTATYAVDTGVSLTWAAPAASTKSSTEDTRSIEYRVWRSLAGFDAWTELTSGGRAASTSLVDNTAVPGMQYEYAVQAWDPGVGTGRGVQATPFVYSVPGDKPQASSVSTPSLPGSVYVGKSFALSGAVLPSHPVGHGIATIECSKNKSSILATFGAQAASDGMSYSTTASLPSAGTWYVRARHEDADHSATYSGWAEMTASLMPMTLTLTAPTTASYASAALSGSLKDGQGSAAASGTAVYLESSSNNVTFATLATVYTNASGAFSYAAKPTATTYYRARFAGTASLSPKLSSSRKVIPRVYLTTPTSPSTMYRTKYYSVYGYLKPRHTSGSYPVRIYRDRYVSGSWRSYGYVKARASNYSTYTKYVASVKLPYAGKWRMRAYHPSDAANAATYSSYRYVTVK